MSITLNRPTAADQVVTISASKEQSELVLSFPLSEAVFEKDGDNLVLSFDSGEKIVIENFYTEYTSENVPDFVVDGATVAGKDFFEALGDETLMPAAGPTAGSEDGGRFYDDSAAALAGGVDALGSVAGGSEFGRFGDLAPGEVAGGVVAAAPEVPVVPAYNAAITLESTSVIEGNNITVTATVTNAPRTDLTITLDQNDAEGNPYTITILAGETSGSVEVGTRADDVYIQGELPTTFSIAGTEGGGYTNLNTADATSESIVKDDSDVTKVTITGGNVKEGTETVEFTIALSNKPEGDTTVTVAVTVNGKIEMRTVELDENGMATLSVPHGNIDDVYRDPGLVTATVTAITGGNYEATSVAGATAIALVTDTIDNATVNLSGSTVLEGAGASYVFTATLSHASQGPTIIFTDKGIITIANGEKTGTLTINARNGEDVYKDGSELTATIIKTVGGNFENLVVGTASATASVNDTIDTVTVNLTASTVNEVAGAEYVFTATLSHKSEGVTTIVTDKGTIEIANGQTVGTLKIASGNGEDVYNDASSLTAVIQTATGGNFENLVVGTGTATAYVNDTDTPISAQIIALPTVEGQPIAYSVVLSHDAQNEDATVTVQIGTGANAQIVTVTIPAGSKVGVFTAENPNTEDIYKDSGSVTLAITGITGGNFENTSLAIDSTKAFVFDTIQTTTASIGLEQKGTDLEVTITLDNKVDADTSATVKFTVNGTEYTATFTGDATTQTQTLSNFIPASDAYGTSLPITASITSFTGGNYEKTATGAGVTDTFSNPATTATMTISVAGGKEANAGTVIATITLSDRPTAAGTLTVTNPDGTKQEIALEVDKMVYEVNVPHGNAEDVYKDASNITVSASITGGGYALAVAGGSDVAFIDNTINTTTLSLQFFDASGNLITGAIAEGTQVTVKASVSNADGLSAAPQSDLTVTLNIKGADGQPITITIPAGQTSSSGTTIIANDMLDSTRDGNFEVKIDSVGANNYEDLVGYGDTATPTTIGVTFTPTIDDGSVTTSDAALGVKTEVTGFTVPEHFTIDGSAGKLPTSDYGTFSVSEDGKQLFFTQTQAYSHDVDTNSATNDVTVYVKDDLGNTGRFEVKMTVVDDVPVATPMNGIYQNVAGATFTGLLGSLGADAAGGTIAFNVQDGTKTEWIYNNETVKLYNDDDGSIVGKVADGTIIFTVVANATTGEYTFTQLKVLDSVTSSSETKTVTLLDDSVKGGNPLAYYITENGLSTLSTGNEFITLTSYEVVVDKKTGVETVEARTVNSNNTSFGAGGGGMIAEGVTLKVDFNENIDGNKVYRTDEITIGVVSNNGHTLATTTLAGYAVCVKLDGIGETYNATFDANNGWDGVNSCFKVTPPEGYYVDYVLITETAKNNNNQGLTFVTSTSVEITETALDLSGLNLGYTITDGDGDTTTETLSLTPTMSDEISAPVLGAVDTDGYGYVLSGSDADNTIIGGAGNDIIFGGGGDNILTGGAGDDIFVISDGGKDTITDFGNGADILDLTAFKSGYEITIAQSQDYSGNGELDTLLTITGANDFLQTIVLEGYTDNSLETKLETAMGDAGSGYINA